MDLPARVAVLENQHRNTERALTDGKSRMDKIDNSLRKVERTIWRASGALGVLLGVIEILVGHYIK